MPSNKNTQMVQRQLTQLLESKQETLQALMPQGFDAKRLLKIAIVAVNENPEIATCSPFSVYRSVAQAMQLGLEPGKASGEAYLIPYKGECTFQASYRGWLKIARGPNVRQIHAAVVYDKDNFRFSEAPKTVLHEPNLDGDRGKLRGAYAVAYDHEGRVFDATWVTADELKKANDLSKNSPAWKNWGDEMRKKVAIKRLCKTLPLDTRGKKLVQIEAGQDAGSLIDPDIDTAEDIIEAGPLRETNPRTESAKKALRAKADEPEDDFDYGPPPMSDEELEMLNG
jgi:recombination protein RecT